MNFLQRRRLRPSPDAHVGPVQRVPVEHSVQRLFAQRASLLPRGQRWSERGLSRRRARRRHGGRQGKVGKHRIKLNI